MREFFSAQISEYPSLRGTTPFARQSDTHAATRSVSLRSAKDLIVWLDKNGDSSAAEEYRIIRTRILQSAGPAQIILMASAWPGDGKTTSAINLAGMLALKANETVLLLEGDMRRSNLSRTLEVPQKPGFSDVLEGHCRLADAVVSVEGLPNLHILTAGSVRSNPAELLASEKWREVCSLVRSQYRWIVIDSPPIASVADYELLEVACDSIVMIVRPDHTKRKFWARAIEMVDRKKLLGVVVNCACDWYGRDTDGYSYYQRPYLD